MRPTGTRHHDPSASNALVESHLYLVQHVVNQLAVRYPRHVDRDELWNAGALGLVDAARRFEHSAGVPFARYAAIRIRGAIIDCTRGRDFSTRSLRRAGRDLRAATERFAATHGRLPEEAELADQLGLDPEALARTRADLERASVLRLDQPAPEGDDLTLADLVEQGDGSDRPDTELERRELVGSLLAAIQHLPHPVDVVVRRYYLEGHRLAEIAVDLEVTEARVSQIRNEGLLALRAFFHGEFSELAGAVPEGTPGGRRRRAFLQSVTEVPWRARVDAAEDWAASRAPAALAS